MNNTPSFTTVYFIASGNQLQVVQYADLPARENQLTIPRGTQLPLKEVEEYLKGGPVLLDLQDQPPLPPALAAFPRELGCEAAAYVPIHHEGQLRGLVLVGARPGTDLTEDVVNAFARTIRLTTHALQPKGSNTEPLNERRARELNAINTLAVHAASTSDLGSFYNLIHEQVRTVIGDFGFVIALYEPKTNSINIPYL